MLLAGYATWTCLFQIAFHLLIRAFPRFRTVLAIHGADSLRCVATGGLLASRSSWKGAATSGLREMSMSDWQLTACWPAGHGCMSDRNLLASKEEEWIQNAHS